MKKILIICLLALASTAYAQEGWKMGLQTGLTFNSDRTSIDGKFVDASNGRTGYRLGIIANKGFNDNYGFHTGINLVGRQFETTGPIKTRYSITTIEVPLAFRMRTNELMNKFHVYVNAGPTIDFHTAARTSDQSTIDNYNRFGSSFMFAAGVEFPAEYGTLTAGFQYNLGLTDAAKSSDMNTSLRYFGLGVGFLF